MTNDEAVKKFSDLVFVLAKARTRQLSDAEDVYQEVFCRYIDKKPQFRDNDHARAWFIKVTVNIARNLYTRYEFLKRADVEDSDLENILSDEDFLSRVEERDSLDGILSRLPEDYRTVLVMRFYFGYNSDEIASLLGKSKASVNSLMQRAKSRCAEVMAKNDMGNQSNNTDRKGDKRDR